MQYIDNDMDELFNKAGNDYPLKTGNGDWDAVLGKLQQPPAPAAPPGSTSNRKYYWLLLLLLLPLSYLIYNTGDNTPGIKDKITNTNTPNKISPKTGNNISENNTPGIQGTEQEEINNITVTKKLHGNKNLTTKINYPVINNSNKNSRLLSPTVLSGKLRGENNQEIYNHMEILPGTRELTFPIMPVAYSLSPYIITPPPFPGISSPATAPKKPKQLKRPGFYGGLVLGPDLSTVKYQEIKNTGFSVGLLAGYQFNYRWAVEAGVLYNRKKYYTDGKYFDKTGANIPSYVNLDYLDGACEMFEVPITVRYNFSRKENTFFATAGATTYFMNKEDYEYGAWAGGSWYQGYKTYKNSGNRIFSNLQFSAGYNYKFSKKLSLRIEPYIKVPVSKIGIGNLPITSTGIYFGIMRNIK